MSVNGIIRLMESVCLGPKVIPLSGAHCTIFCAEQKVYTVELLNEITDNVINRFIQLNCLMKSLIMLSIGLYSGIA